MQAVSIEIVLLHKSKFTNIFMCNELPPVTNIVTLTWSYKKWFSTVSVHTYKRTSEVIVLPHTASKLRDQTEYEVKPPFCKQLEGKAWYVGRGWVCWGRSSLAPLFLGGKDSTFPFSQNLFTYPPTFTTTTRFFSTREKEKIPQAPV